MKILTREIAQSIASEVSTVAEFIDRLEEDKYIRAAPRLAMTKQDVYKVLKQSDRVRTELNSPYLLKRLVDAGYLKREKDMNAANIGRRPYLYKLTPKGQLYVNGFNHRFKKKEETAEIIDS